MDTGFWRLSETTQLATKRNRKLSQGNHLLEHCSGAIWEPCMQAALTRLEYRWSLVTDSLFANSRLALAPH